MGLTVTIDHPDFPDGYEFGAEGLGTLKNREPAEISEEQEQSFVSSRRMSVKDALGQEGSIFTVEGQETAEVPEEEESAEEEETAGEEGTTEQEAPAEEDE